MGDSLSVWIAENEIPLEREQKEFKVGLKFIFISDDDLAYIYYILQKEPLNNPGSAG